MHMLIRINKKNEELRDKLQNWNKLKISKPNPKVLIKKAHIKIEHRGNK